MSSGRVAVAPIPSENITITRDTLSCAAATSFSTPIAASIGQPRGIRGCSLLTPLSKVPGPASRTRSNAFRRAPPIRT
jgi:hypothetical protein